LGNLDVLVNNAGIADPHDGPPSRVSVDVIERVLRTHFLGAVAVTHAVLPLLRKSYAGRIVNVSSDLGSITKHSDPTRKYAQVKVLGYCASKAALNMFTVQLAFELKDQGIAVNSVNPGFTATDLNGHRGQQSVEEGAARRSCASRSGSIGDPACCPRSRLSHPPDAKLPEGLALLRSLLAARRPC
jgi:NAD(P)-dependent dehydrogenase (short-subunit alcohol dehydrogenase family)